MVVNLSRELNPLEAITQSSEWSQLGNVQRVDYLNNYLTDLEGLAEQRLDGGWSQYQRENPEFLRQVEEAQKTSFRNESVNIGKQADEVASQWWRETAGEGKGGGFLEQVMVAIGRGTWQTAALGASALGFDEAAERFTQNRDIIAKGYNTLANDFARNALNADTTDKVSSELYNFAANFFPALQPDDAALLHDIAKKNGVLDDTGLFAAALNPHNVAGMLGHFGRIITFMRLLPAGKAVAGTGIVKASAQYALRYAVATGISEGLDVPIHQNSIGNMLGTMGGTFGAMFAGGALSRFAMQSPVMVSLASKMPPIVSDFFQGRIADVGESVANSVEFAIHTGDPWKAIEAFPAALVANLIEELIIDLPGVGGGFSRRARLEGTTRAISDIQRVQQGIAEKLQKEGDSPGAIKLRAASERLDKALVGHKERLHKWVAAELKREDSILSINKDTINARMAEFVQQGQTTDEAMENAVTEEYVDFLNIKVAFDHDLAEVEKGVVASQDQIAARGAEIAQQEGVEAKVAEEQAKEEFRTEQLGEVLDIEKEAAVEEPLPAEVAEIVAEKRPTKESRAVAKVDAAAKKAKPEPVKPVKLSQRIKKDFGGISLASAEAMGWDLQALKEAGGGLFLNTMRRSGGAKIDSELIPELQDEGVIPSGLNPKQANEWLFKQLTGEPVASVRAVTEEVGQIDKVSAIYRVEEAVQAGQITEEQADSELKRLGIEDEFAAIESQSNMKGGAFESFVRWLARVDDGRLRDVVDVKETAYIHVSPKAFKKEYKRDYAGDRIVGALHTRFDAKALVELAYGASPSVGHHEAFHLVVEASALTDGQRRTLFDRYDNVGDMANAYGRWAEHRESGTVIGRIFSALRKFLQSLKNVLTGKGYTSVEQAFTDVYNGNVKMQAENKSLIKYRNEMVSDGFITKDGGFTHVVDHKDYPDAYKNGEVYKARYESGLSYGAPTAAGLAHVQADLKKYDPLFYRDLPVTLETKDKVYYFSTGDFFAKRGKLETVLKSADVKPIPTGTWYAIDDAKELTGEADTYLNVKGLSKAASDVVEKVRDNFRWLKDRRKGDPFNWAERYFALPALMKHKSPYIRGMIETEYRRDRRRQALTRELMTKLRPLYDISDDVYEEARELMLKGDAAGRDLKGADFKGYSQASVDAYNSAKETAAFVLDKEIRWIGAKYVDLLDSWKETIQVERLGTALVEVVPKKTMDRLSKETEDALEIFARLPISTRKNVLVYMRDNQSDRVAGRLVEMINEIKGLEDLKDKGYMPHVFDESAKWVIRFDVVPADLNDTQRKAFMEALRGLSGDTQYWVSRTKADFTGADQNEPVKYRFTYRNSKPMESDVAALQKVLGKEKVVGRVNDTDRDMFGMHHSRSQVSNILGSITDIAKQKAKGKQEEEVLIEGIMSVTNVLDTMRKATGWNRHRIKREGVYGYETQDLKAVWTQYVKGYAGLHSKREAAINYYQLYGEIPTDQKNHLKVAENFIETVLHNRDWWDEAQGKFVGALFTKYLGFNIPFHIRNRFQPWYQGVPVLMKHFGIKKLAAIGKTNFAVQKDLRWLEMWLARNDISMDNETDLVDQIKTISDADKRAIMYALQKGLLDEQLPGEWSDAYKDMIDETNLNKAMGATLNLLKRWVTLSDTKNRLQTYLTAVRMGASLDDSIELSREANVVYKKWNIPGFFATEFGRKVKVAFPFQKYLWHTTEWQVRNGVKGLLGPTMAYWLISALLGGKEAAPFMRWLKSVVGIENATAARKHLIKLVGGRRKLLEILDIGAFGMVGLDMSTHFRVDPLGVFDPIIGGNIFLSEWRNVRNAFDSAKRARWKKALLEDQPFMIRAFSKVARAWRQSTEGVTTYSGDTVMDYDGKPLTLNVKDAVAISIGLMPARLSKFYRARRSAKELAEYFGTEKARIGTRYKLALHRRDQEELTYTKGLVEEFNRSLTRSKLGDQFVVPQITKGTLVNWKKGADTKRLRAISRYLYP